MLKKDISRICQLLFWKCRWVWSLVSSWGTYRRYISTRPSLWRCELMEFSEGFSSVDNVRVLVIGICSTILVNANALTIGLPDLGSFSRLVSTSLKYLNLFCATHSLTVTDSSMLLFSFTSAFSLSISFYTGCVKWHELYLSLHS